MFFRLFIRPFVLLLVSFVLLLVFWYTMIPCTYICNTQHTHTHTTNSGTGLGITNLMCVIIEVRCKNHTLIFILTGFVVLFRQSYSIIHSVCRVCAATAALYTSNTVLYILFALKFDMCCCYALWL